MSLESAILYLNDLMATIPNIKSAPDYPPESSSSFPFSIVYPGSGLIELHPGLVSQAQHTLNLEVYTVRSILPKAVKTLIPIVQLVINEIKNDPTLGGTVDTVIMTPERQLSYTTQSVDYGDIKCLVLRFDVVVKIRE